MANLQGHEYEQMGTRGESVPEATPVDELLHTQNAYRQGYIDGLKEQVSELMSNLRGKSRQEIWEEAKANANSRAILELVLYLGTFATIVFAESQSKWIKENKEHDEHEEETAKIARWAAAVSSLVSTYYLEKRFGFMNALKSLFRLAGAFGLPGQLVHIAVGAGLYALFEGRRDTMLPNGNDIQEDVMKVLNILLLAAAVPITLVAGGAAARAAEGALSGAAGCVKNSCAILVCSGDRKHPQVEELNQDSV